ncbi:MAG: hypothetical protein FWH08_05915 [Oscillospiraceae bacterium]|nr:hypothetical protein [Oscillospiraceae bacterium]
MLATNNMTISLGASVTIPVTQDVTVIVPKELKPAAGNITVSLGKPITVPVLVPVEHKSTPTCINDPFMVDGECYKVTAMSFGNPHGAVFVDDVDSVDVQKLGSALGTHVLFPKGASIVFIQVLDKENIKVRLWQKGQPETDFTPEAACVAGTAAMMCQKILLNRTNVSFGGNTFIVNWDRGNSEVTLTGSENLLSVEGSCANR